VAIRSGPPTAFRQARRAAPAFAVAVACGVLVAFIGLEEAPVPAAGGGRPVPAWRILAIAPGVVPVLSLHSGLRDLEATKTRAVAAAQRRYLSGMVAACFAGFLIPAAVALDASTLAALLRSLLGWLGLSLVAGRVLGWSMAWPLPLLAAAVLIYWGADPDAASGHAWWDFTARPYSDVPAGSLAAVLLCAGTFAYWATPWRLRRTLHGRRGGRADASSEASQVVSRSTNVCDVQRRPRQPERECQL
jgi:hypothetical protein